jgi:hypothetical protein
MQNLLPLILIGFLVYFLFSRKGGMGCCGGHRSHEPRRHQDGHTHSGDHSQDRMGKVIDLRKDEYTILPAKNDKETGPQNKAKFPS